MGMTSREFALLERAGIVHRNGRDVRSMLPFQYGRFCLVSHICRGADVYGSEQTNDLEFEYKSSVVAG
jgi:hypothetical protein